MYVYLISYHVNVPSKNFIHESSIEYCWKETLHHQQVEIFVTHWPPSIDCWPHVPGMKWILGQLTMLSGGVKKGYDVWYHDVIPSSMVVIGNTSNLWEQCEKIKIELFSGLDDRMKALSLGEKTCRCTWIILLSNWCIPQKSHWTCRDGLNIIKLYFKLISQAQFLENCTLSHELQRQQKVPCHAIMCIYIYT